MLSSPLALTYNALTVNLNRINQDNHSSEYFGKTASGDSITCSVKHTIPGRGLDGESHLIRLDIDHYAAGVYQRTVSTWTVVKTTGSTQDDTTVQLALNALIALVPVIDQDVIGRQS
jgi:hypothetical protein